jgi:hypothetical protein
VSELVVYLDLDGVFADYDAGIRLAGFEIDPEYKNDLNRSGTNNPLKRQMYEAIKGTQFYRYLPRMRGAVSLYLAVEEFDPIFVTAAPKFDGNEDNYFLNPHWLGAAYHKRAWVEEVLLPACERRAAAPAWPDVPPRVPIPDERFVCTTSARKKEFMHRRRGKHQLLIDDRVDNCRWWVEAGGDAILHTDAVSSIEAIKAYRIANDL